MRPRPWSCPSRVDIGHHGPGFHDDAPLEEIVGDIDRGARAYLAAGITSIVDAQVTRRELDGYRAARERGVLGVRVTAMPISSQLDEYAAIGLAGRVRRRPAGDRADEVLRGRRADRRDGGVHRRRTAPSGEFTGSLYWRSEDEFRDAIRSAHAAGWQIGVHAQGDRAIDRVLDAYEAALEAQPRDDHRHRIEHCGGPRPDQLERMARLGVMAVGQPRYFWDAGDAWLGVARRGARPSPPAVPRDDRRRRPIRAVERCAGRVLPAARHDLLGGHADDGRRRVVGADQALTVEEALRACTLDAAASLLRRRPPRLARGRQARGRRRPRRRPVRDAGRPPRRRSRVDLTVLGGEIVYRRSRAGAATSDSIS